MSQSVTCRCSREFDVHILRQDEYKRAKRVLDVSKFPTFLGRQTFSRNASQGGALMFTFDGEDVGFNLINPFKNVSLAMAVVPEHQRHGLGASIVRYSMTNFRRVIESKVPYFQSLGYEPIGEPKQGRRFLTQVMVRSDLLGLAGRCSKALSDSCRCHEESELAFHGDGSDLSGTTENPVPDTSEGPRISTVANAIDKLDNTHNGTEV